MSTNLEELEVILDEFPRQELSRIAEERGIEITSREKEDYINQLKQVAWTNDDIQNLVGRLNRILEENESMGFWVLTITENPDLEDFAESLEERNPVEFDENDYPIEGGYEIQYQNGNRLEFRQWSVTEQREFDRVTGTVQEQPPDISTVDVEINTEEERAYINTTNYFKAKSLQRFLKDEGFELGDIGHKQMRSDDAKQKIKGFVNELEDELEEVDDES